MNRGRGISALALTAAITGGIFFGGPVASSADPGGGGRGGGPASSASSSAGPSGAPSSDPGSSGGGSGGDSGGTRGAGGGNGAGNGNGGGNGAGGSVSGSSPGSGGGGGGVASSSSSASGGRGGGGSAGSQGDNSQGQGSSQTSQSSQGGGTSSQSTGSSGRGGSNSGGSGNGNGSRCSSSCHTGQQTGTATFTPAPNLSTSGTTLAVTPSTTNTGSGSGSGSKGSATKPIQLPPTIITVPSKHGHGKSGNRNAAAVAALGAGFRAGGSRSPSTGSGTGLAGLLGGLPISTPATAANRFHHSSSGKGTPTFITRPAPSDVPNVIQRIERVVPVEIWIAMGLALLAAAAGGASALWSRRRVRRQANKFAEISAAAVTDPLTGVLNRRGFGDAVERELARARRYDRSFVLAYVDVRGMKAVNDSEGHRAGDELLRTAAQLLKDSARENDVVGRLGGDEMGILLVEVNDDGASAVRRRIQDRVAESREAMGFHSHWDLTIGTAAFPQDGDTLDELLSTADRRLYEQRGIALLYDDDRR